MTGRGGKLNRAATARKIAALIQQRPRLGRVLREEFQNLPLSVILSIGAGGAVGALLAPDDASASTGDGEGGAFAPVVAAAAGGALAAGLRGRNLKGQLPKKHIASAGVGAGVAAMAASEADKSGEGRGETMLTAAIGGGLAAALFAGRKPLVDFPTGKAVLRNAEFDSPFGAFTGIGHEGMPVKPALIGAGVGTAVGMDQTEGGADMALGKFMQTVGTTAPGKTRFAKGLVATLEQEAREKNPDATGAELWAEWDRSLDEEFAGTTPGVRRAIIDLRPYLEHEMVVRWGFRPNRAGALSGEFAPVR